MADYFTLSAPDGFHEPCYQGSDDLPSEGTEAFLCDGFDTVFH